jgi:hypothetical protein
MQKLQSEFHVLLELEQISLNYPTMRDNVARQLSNNIEMSKKISELSEIFLECNQFFHSCTGRNPVFFFS